jgi:hypothetical protein
LSDRGKDRDKDKDRDRDRYRYRDRDKDKDKDKDRDRDRDRDRYRDRDQNGRHHRNYYCDNNGRRIYDVTNYAFFTVDYDPGNYGGYHYGLNAYDNGYDDGLYTGANDARRGQSYDPERSHYYSGGTGGFSSVWGQRTVYQLAYRDGFLRGYDEGFRNWQRYCMGGMCRRP